MTSLPIGTIPDVSATFGPRLRRLREQKDLSQFELAQLVDVEPGLISRYERGVGMPGSRTLVALARVLDVTVGRLLLGEEDDARSRAHAPIRDAVLLERFRELDSLDRKQRQLVIDLIDAVLASSHLGSVQTHRTRQS